MGSLSLYFSWKWENQRIGGNWVEKARGGGEMEEEKKICWEMWEKFNKMQIQGNSESEV